MSLKVPNDVELSLYGNEENVEVDLDGIVNLSEEPIFEEPEETFLSPSTLFDS